MYKKENKFGRTLNRLKIMLVWRKKILLYKSVLFGGVRYTDYVGDCPLLSNGGGTWGYFHITQSHNGPTIRHLSIPFPFSIPEKSNKPTDLHQPLFCDKSSGRHCYMDRRASLYENQSNLKSSKIFL